MDIVIDRLAAVAGAFLVLSLVVEKINDFIKLRNPKLRLKTKPDVEDAEDKEKKREQGILTRNILVGIGVALFLKADAIQMIVSGQPGEVIGWENVISLDDDDKDEMEASNINYFASLQGKDSKFLFTWLYTLCGIAMTGVGLSFGSKFWHDVVGVIYEVKKAKENLSQQAGKKNKRKTSGATKPK